LHPYGKIADLPPAPNFVLDTDSLS